MEVSAIEMRVTGKFRKNITSKIYKPFLLRFVIWLSSFSTFGSLFDDCVSIPFSAVGKFTSSKNKKNHILKIINRSKRDRNEICWQI